MPPPKGAVHELPRPDTNVKDPSRALNMSSNTLENIVSQPRAKDMNGEMQMC